MNIEFIAAIVESIFYAGRVSSDHKLDKADFEQLALASAGSIIRLTFYEERRAGKVSSFISEMVELKEVPVIKGKRGIKTIDASIFYIPHGLGLLNIYPVDECTESEVDYKYGFTRLDPGSERIFNREALDDIGENAFTTRKGVPILYCDDSVKNVLIEGIFKGPEMELTLDVARKVINDILGEVLKVAGWPVDVNDNSNPNAKILNAKLAEPKSA